MDRLPFISVVIPAYNEEKYLPYCLKSLKNQIYPKNKYAIIVIDNNSTDKTIAIAKKFGATVIKEKKQGHVYSLNTGLKNAVGDIFAVTDADSIPSLDWLKTIAETFENQLIVGVTGSINLDSKSPIVNTLFKRIHYGIQTFHFYIKKPTFYGPNMAMRAKVFKDLIHEVDIRYEIGGDAELGIQLNRYGKVIFAKELSVKSSSRRFKDGINIKDIYKYVDAYFNTIWLQKPPKTHLIPVR